MKIEEINRYVLLILMFTCIFAVFKFNSLTTIKIEIAKTELEVSNLKKELKQKEIKALEDYVKGNNNAN